MALVQIRVRCEHRFRDCPKRCFGCGEAKVLEVKTLSGMKNNGDVKAGPRKCKRCGLDYGTCIHTTQMFKRKEDLRFQGKG
jgi:hypothetical protein